MRIRMYGESDIGRVRKKNQDSVYFNGEQGIVVVADGIGGRKGGEVASQMAVRGLKKQFVECESLRHESIIPFLASSIDKVNQGIIEKGQTTPAIEGMGTTLNCLLFVGEKVYIAHMGDSRTYLYTKGQMWQMTVDHNVEVYVSRGWLPRETLQGRSKPGALVRALGLSPECEVDIYEKALHEGEIYVTCSDGLTGMVDDRKITAMIRENEKRLDVLPRLLIAEANRNGGKDNITVVVTEVQKD